MSAIMPSVIKWYEHEAWFEQVNAINILHDVPYLEVTLYLKLLTQ